MVPVVASAMLLASCSKLGVEDMSEWVRRLGEAHLGDFLLMATKVPIIGFGLADVDG